MMPPGVARVVELARRPPEEWPSVRLARARAREREQTVRTLNLEPLLHGELLAAMAAVLERHTESENP
jgi:hypothetical protein